MTTAQLRNAIGEWADHCFTHKTSSQIGVLEEIGEISKAILKGRQGIRGFDNEEFRLAAIKDGIADCAIYVLHWCKVNDVNPGEWPHQFLSLTEEQSLSNLAHNAGRLLDITPATENSTKNHIAHRILEELTNLAAFYKWNLYRDCVAPTWEKVSKRDWKKNKTDGGESVCVPG